MTWVTTGCDAFYKYWYESTEITNLNDLPDDVREALTLHLNARLGKYAAKLSFDRAFYVDVGGYFSRHPDEQRRPDWPYSYEVHLNLRLSDDGPVEFCAQIGLDQRGGVLHEINLPNLAASPEKGAVLGASQLLALADTLGVPVEKASLDLKYDDKADVLEYRVEYGVDPKEDGCNLGILFVTAHDPSKYRWFRTKLMAVDQGHDRPNNGVNATVRPVTGLAQTARPAPVRPARYAER